MNKFNQLYNLIMEELTQDQKKLVDTYTNKRSFDLSFGPMFKSPRTYFELSTNNLIVIPVPTDIQYLLDQEGYYCPDYRKGYVYKKDDKLKNKPVKLIKVLDKSLKDNPDKFLFNQLKKEFDERLGTSRKETVKCMLCITYDPYDIAGMSTDRSWTSCMNLSTGMFKDTPLKQVQYGGMCAYLIKEDDKEINHPIARIAIKRLVGENGTFIFMSEDRIYGDEQFAIDLHMPEKVEEILNKSNKITGKDETVFTRKDDNSYSNKNITSVINYNKLDINKLSKEQIDALSKDSNIPFDFVMEHGDKLNLLEYFKTHVISLKDDKDVTNFNKLYFKYKNKIDKTQLFNEVMFLPKEVINDLIKSDLDFSTLYKNTNKLDENILEQHIDELPLTKIIMTFNLTNSNLIKLILNKYIDKVDWEYYSKNNKKEILHLVFQSAQKYINWIEYEKLCVKTMNEDNKIIFLNFISDYSMYFDVDYFCKNVKFKTDTFMETLDGIEYIINKCNYKIREQFVESLIENNDSIRKSEEVIKILKLLYLN